MSQVSSWTIQSLLEWTERYLNSQGLANPRVDAQILLSHILKKKRIDLYVEYDRLVGLEELSQFKSLIQRRAKKEPLQYITGFQEFWSLMFHIDAGVLIPRPETECLVEQSLELLKDRLNQSVRILDMGCGSGILAIVFAKEFPNGAIDAIDISEGALKNAQVNAHLHGVENQITFSKSDLFSEFSSNKKFDLVVSNPPYITEKQWEHLDPQIRNYEPKEAFVGGRDGIDFHLRILKESPRVLNTGGYLVMEIAPDQVGMLKDSLAEFKNFSSVRITKDYENRERVFTVQYG